MENALKKAPAAPPAASCIFSRKAELNPVWHDRIIAFFDVVLPGKDTISEAEWVALKKKFGDFEAWLAAKPSDHFDKEDLSIIRAALKDGIPGKLQKLIDRNGNLDAQLEAWLIACGKEEELGQWKNTLKE